MATSPARQPTIQGSDTALTIRVESLTLGASLQRDPNIRNVFVSLKVLGASFNTPDLRKVSPPIRVNETFTVPVGPSSKAQQELLRVMTAQYGDRKGSDIAFTVCWYDAASSSGDGEPVAFGSVSMRGMWDSRRDLASQVVKLIDDDTQEETKLVISTSVIPVLTRIMPRGR